MHILGIEHKHSGEIKCAAYLPEKPENFVTTFTDLVVLPIPHPDKVASVDSNLTDEPDVPAYFLRGLDDCTVLRGHDVLLDVFYRGYPEPEIKWMRAVSLKRIFRYFILTLRV